VLLCTVIGADYGLGTNSAAVLENIHHKFAILVAAPTDGNTKRLGHCKVHLILLTDGGNIVQIGLSLKQWMTEPLNLSTVK